MKNLNDGQGHGIDEILKVGEEEAAKQFSEGNKYLQQILLELWKLGIETSACCKGEQTQDHTMDNNLIFKIPYIAIRVTEKSKQQILQLIHYIVNEKGSSRPNITYKNYIFNNENYNVLVLERTFLSNANVNNMFKQLLSAIKKMQNQEKIEEQEDVKLSINLIEYLSDKTLDYGTKSMHVSISHNNQCNIAIKNIKGQTKKQHISAKTIKRIKDFCKQFVQQNNSYSI